MKLWICVVNGEENEDLGEDERIIADCESAADLLATAEIFREEVDYETDKYFWLEESNISPDIIANTYDELLENIQDYGLL
jgi:hypothetical protein